MGRAHKVYPMNLPNKLTVLRLILSPLYFLVFFFPVWTGYGEVPSAFLLLAIFIVIEVSDVLDGHVARSRNLVTDIGKVLDPFADVFSRMTYFICFTSTGLMPVWIFTILMYRELAIMFLRMYMMQKGVAMAASVWGKLKAVFYALSGIVGLAAIVISRSFPSFSMIGGIRLLALITFVVAAVASVGSFLVYVRTVLESERS
jgi:CDP-diacylglycerol---glycerol-3-phosphate 3-phosphatidyltransferase